MGQRHKKLTVLGIILLATLTTGWFFYFNKLDITKFLNYKKSVGKISEIKKDVISPPPLRSFLESKKTHLTPSGTLEWTNTQRISNGLQRLTSNSQLNSAANRKVQDMFNRQYFEHESPDGKNAGNLAEIYGYEFIAIGENLALGNYGNDENLVKAWMDSPGHRANILSDKFTEIGIAVAQGKFEGQETWLAVQIFGLPLSSCPKIDEGLKTQIDNLEMQIAELKIKSDEMQKQLDQHKKAGNYEEYNKLVPMYNKLANQINILVAQVKGTVASYNVQVSNFNTCIDNH